jgi:electron transport complex protein RnfD
MYAVVLMLAPASVVHMWFYGVGLLANIVVAIAAGLATEAVALRLRGRPVDILPGDGSAVVAAVLFAFALPPLCPWWVTAIGMVFAIGFAKHLYGGLGHNLFNPAMAGYALVLVSFPALMTAWPAPDIGDLDYRRPGPATTLRYTLTGRIDTAAPGLASIDAIARPTVLARTRDGLAARRTMDELRTSPFYGDFGGAGWEWVGNLIAIGGLGLLLLGVIRWHTPAAFLGGLLGSAGVFWLLDSNVHPSPGFHLFTGGAMLGAFFIVTDPVSSPVTARGRLIFGAGAGVLTFVIRTWGIWPDGVAFAVLAMNAAVPLIDRYTRPVPYGRAVP